MPMEFAFLFGLALLALAAIVATEVILWGQSRANEMERKARSGNLPDSEAKHQKVKRRAKRLAWIRRQRAKRNHKKS